MRHEKGQTEWHTLPGLDGPRYTGCTERISLYQLPPDVRTQQLCFREHYCNAHNYTQGYLHDGGARNPPPIVAAAREWLERYVKRQERLRAFRFKQSVTKTKVPETIIDMIAYRYSIRPDFVAQIKADVWWEQRYGPKEIHFCSRGKGFVGKKAFPEICRRRQGCYSAGAMAMDFEVKEYKREINRQMSCNNPNYLNYRLLYGNGRNIIGKIVEFNVMGTTITDEGFWHANRVDYHAGYGKEFKRIVAKDIKQWLRDNKVEFKESWPKKRLISLMMKV